MARLVVVIVNWNGERFLPACLAALEAQSWRDFKLVIVDNASSDGSIACARRHFPGAELIRNQANLGFAEANDIGLATALADPAVEYVLTLNNDAIPAPDFLERLLVCADGSSTDYGSWQGKVVFADDPRILDAVGIELTRDSVATQLGQREVDVGQYTSGDVYGVNAAAALYSRRFIEDVMVGGEFFDRDFFSYLEDVDVAVRGVGAGWKAAYVADAVVRHIGSASSGVESRFKWRVTSRNKLYLQVKNYSIREVVTSLAPSLEAEMRLAFGFLRASQRGVLGTYLASRVLACLGLRPMFAKRRAILKQRVAPTIFATPRPRLSPASSDVRLSVVIPNWNGREEIDECLAALREQTVEDLEVIVVDNASTDGSLEFIRDHYPEVIALPLPVNLGFAGGVNVGINASNGEFVALLNNDAIADEHWAEELLAAMDHADIAASLMLERDNPEVVDSRGEFLSRWGLPYPDGRGQRISGMDFDAYPEIFAASGGASIYRRSVLEEIGTFDTQYFAYLEDVDIGFRARFAGYRIVLAPRAQVLHKRGATARTVGQFQLYHFIKNSHLLVWKNLPLPLLIKVLPRFGAIQILLFGAAVLRRAGLTALRAHAASLVAFPMIVVKRRRVQRSRRMPAKEIECWLTDRWPMNTKPKSLLRPHLLRERLMPQLVPQQRNGRRPTRATARSTSARPPFGN
jgi:GT2 family glycosyltransferase